MSKLKSLHKKIILSWQELKLQSISKSWGVIDSDILDGEKVVSEQSWFTSVDSDTCSDSDSYLFVDLISDSCLENHDLLLVAYNLNLLQVSNMKNHHTMYRRDNE